tara:strand:+ start:13927 stop:15303 length:1377 start_codon:yes stop_codon:yes gene_type:complete
MKHIVYYIICLGLAPTLLFTNTLKHNLSKTHKAKITLSKPFQDQSKTEYDTFRSGNLLKYKGRPDCPDGTVDDCSGDGDCCPESWVGDGFEDCEDQAFGCDLTCYDNDGGDCSDDTTTTSGTSTTTTGYGCPDGYVQDCVDEDCCPESWIGDGFEDCEDQAYGCDLTCYDNDGGDCGPACDEGLYECLDGSCVEDEADCPDASCSDIGGNESWISDGYCDDINNNEECGWDGGDCCGSTCISSDLYDCGSDADWSACNSECLDPDANDDCCYDNSCQFTIEGCTNPLADNYNPDATVDDGSCEFPGGTFVITCDGGTWQDEITWDLIYNPSGEIILSGNAPYLNLVSLDPGDYYVHAYDSFGDGWNGNMWSILDSNINEEIFTYTLENGEEGLSNIFTIGCVSGDVNSDSIINISDAVLIVNSIINNTTEDLIVCGDMNGDGVLNVSDLIIIVDLILS